MAQIDDQCCSDDEIFFGKLSLKEFKRHILWNGYHQSKTFESLDQPSVEKLDSTLKIIESHSEPNLRSTDCGVNDSVVNSPSWDMKTSDDSFVRMETMVSELCISPKNQQVEELNNTLEVIEYILNHGPPSTAKAEDKDVDTNIQTDIEVKPEDQCYPLELQTPKPEPEKGGFSTPMCSQKKIKRKLLLTPATADIKSKTPVFKTPRPPLSHKKLMDTPFKKTPTSNAYKHICSPVATYIKNCPQVPLVQDIHPKKPLPGASSIPKFVKSSSQPKIGNKENFNLPSVAYKSAKTTKMIDVPDEQRLPQSQWVKKITTSLPRPTVIKHDSREMNLAKRVLLSQQESSFADLSYRQAEVSVCTQKTAFKTAKRL